MTATRGLKLLLPTTGTASVANVRGSMHDHSLLGRTEGDRWRAPALAGEGSARALTQIKEQRVAGAWPALGARAQLAAKSKWLWPSAAPFPLISTLAQALSASQAASGLEIGHHASPDFASAETAPASTTLRATPSPGELADSIGRRACRPPLPRRVPFRTRGHAPHDRATAGRYLADPPGVEPGRAPRSASRRCSPP